MKKNYFHLTTTPYPIEICPLTEGDFNHFVAEKYKEAKKIILVDENTNLHCLENLLGNFSELVDAEIIELPSGEDNKLLSVCEQVWEALLEYEISRHDLIINLGGGVVTDMGGFIASLYKRGLDFINIPTSLLAMVDASVGGKTGVDLTHYKNIIGVFSNPQAVFVDISFLETLPLEEKQGGYVEMLKHGLIADKSHWQELKKVNIDEIDVTPEMIYHSLQIKNEIVTQDPFEKNLRKVLNFGHTFGHALEAAYLEQCQHINHGIAVAVGIIVESYWSKSEGLLNEGDFQQIMDFFSTFTFLPDITSVVVENLWKYAQNDKKNSDGIVRSSLLQEIGKATFDYSISKELFAEGFDFYNRNSSI